MFKSWHYYFSDGSAKLLGLVKLGATIYLKKMPMNSFLTYSRLTYGRTYLFFLADYYFFFVLILDKHCDLTKELYLAIYVI